MAQKVQMLETLRNNRPIVNMLSKAHKEALRIINKHKEEVTLIAKTLLEHEQITAEEIDYLLKNGHLKRDEGKIKEEAKAEDKKEEKPAPAKKAPSKKAPAKKETK